MDNADNPPSSIDTVTVNKDKLKAVSDATRSHDKSKYNPSGTIKTIGAQQQKVFCPTAAAQVKQPNWKTCVDKECSLV